jgi:hypothetical protein
MREAMVRDVMDRLSARGLSVVVETTLNKLRKNVKIILKRLKAVSNMIFWNN